MNGVDTTDHMETPKQNRSEIFKIMKLRIFHQVFYNPETFFLLLERNIISQEER